MTSVFGINLTICKLKTVNTIQLQLFEQYKYAKLVSSVGILRMEELNRIEKPYH